MSTLCDVFKTLKSFFENTGNFQEKQKEGYYSSLSYYDINILDTMWNIIMYLWVYILRCNRNREMIAGISLGTQGKVAIWW